MPPTSLLRTLAMNTCARPRFIRRQPVEEALVFTTKVVHGTLLFVDEIEQLFDRNLPVDSSASKLSKIEVEG